MNSSYRIEMFFDGDCPLCLREKRFLQRLDRHHRILFTDITSEEFDAATVGKTYDTLMAEIHGRLPDGRWITGVEVFRRLYAAVGLGPLVLPTRLPVIKQLLNVGYRLFARNRLRLTGRCERHPSLTQRAGIKPHAVKIITRTRQRGTNASLPLADAAG